MFLWRHGATVFFSSHILSDAEALCDRVGLLVNGKLRLESTVDALLDKQVEYFQAASEGLAADGLAGYTPHSVQGDTNYYRLDDEDAVDHWIDAVRQSSGRVYRVTPHRATLEDYFVATVREEAAMSDEAATAGDKGATAGEVGEPS